MTTALSLTAQYMLSRKLLENWWVWLTADVIYIGLYCYKSLYLFSRWTNCLHRAGISSYPEGCPVAQSGLSSVTL